MGKIKGWERDRFYEQNDPSQPVYNNTLNKRFEHSIWIRKVYSSEGDYWTVQLQRVDRRGLSIIWDKVFTNKKEAMDFAVDYMKANPEGA